MFTQMKHKGHHVQCLLRKGTTHQMSWIPSKFAVLGKFLMLKQDNGSWSDNWEIVSRYTAIPSSQMYNLSTAYKYHRQNTDI